MSKSKKKISVKKKKVITAKSNATTSTVAAPKKRIQPTRSKKRTNISAIPKDNTLIYGRQHYIIMAAGFGLIMLGMLLMSGGNMPSPDVWDESIIFGWRRTVLAPFLMIVGLVVEVYAIFKK